MSILKFQIAGDSIDELVYITKSSASGNQNAICTDGIHVFVIYGTNTVMRFLCSDMSYVDDIFHFNGSDGFHNAIGLSVDNTWLYVSDNINTSSNRILQFLKSDLSFVNSIVLGSNMPQALNNNGAHLYMSRKFVLT